MAPKLKRKAGAAGGKAKVAKKPAAATGAKIHVVPSMDMSPFSLSEFASSVLSEPAELDLSARIWHSALGYRLLRAGASLAPGPPGSLYSISSRPQFLH